MSCNDIATLLGKNVRLTAQVRMLREAIFKYLEGGYLDGPLGVMEVMKVLELTQPDKEEA